MSNHIEVIIRNRLEIFNPTVLIIHNESSLHKGHYATQKKKIFHFKIIISSVKFLGLKQLDGHRLIYNQFLDLIPYPIHALSIEINELFKRGSS